METAHLPWGINGLPISSKYIAWIELFVFHILTPDASFIGHLAGILAGFLYTSTPAGFIFDVIVSKITGRNIKMSKFQPISTILLLLLCKILNISGEQIIHTYQGMTSS